MHVDVSKLQYLVEQLNAVNGDVVATCQVIDKLYEALAEIHNELVQATLEELVAPGWEGAVTGPCQTLGMHPPVPNPPVHLTA